MSSIVEGERHKNVELSEKADKVAKCEDAVSVVREYETLVKTKKRNIACIAYRKGYVFIRFRETDTFVNMKKELGISKLTIIFKINIAKQLGGCLISKLISNFLPLFLFRLIKRESVGTDIRLFDKLYGRQTSETERVFENVTFLKLKKM